jgi:hypothetical protein
LLLSIVARPHEAGLIRSWRADSLAFVWLDPELPHVAKLPKCHAINFLTKRAAIADRYRLQAVTEVACEFIANYVVPQMIIRSARLRPGKFVLVDAKRLLQQYLRNPDFASQATFGEFPSVALRR